ncbi:MAG: NERD domain-containing protein [Alphaproteobacteria bacterium]|nr:NERD domain-containing protein [Alphaproteobacteria bacterium]
MFLTLFFEAIYPHLPLLLVGLALAGLAEFIRARGRARASRIKGEEGERLVARVVDESGFEAMHDVLLPHARRDCFWQIDHLVCLPVGIAVLETKNFSGLIYASKGDPRWTQAIGRRRHRFLSPIVQNDGHIQAVEAIVPRGIAVFGQVLFVGDARFPKGMPDEVSNLTQLRQSLAAVRGMPVPDDVQEAWAALTAEARRDGEARAAHREGVEESKAAWRNRRKAL